MDMRPLRALSFLEALRRFVIRGRGRFLDEKKITERLAICIPCDHFTGDGCDICGCCVNDKTTLFNKIALPTEKCPDNKWLEVK